MKSSKVVGVWRPVMGVALVGAMALGVSALAGPRGADQGTREAVKTGTEVTRLVTGDPTQLNAVAGAGATLKLHINPVSPPIGRCIGGSCTSGAAVGNACANDAACPPMPAYPAGVSIVGNELRVDRATNKDGFRAWFNVQVSDWDPNGDGPNMNTFQVKVNCAGYYASDCLDLKPNGTCNGGTNNGLACPNGDSDCPGGTCGSDLKPAITACPGDDPAPCVSAYGENWATCTAGQCDAGYIDPATGRQDSWCTAGGGGCTGFGVALGTCNYNWFTVSNAVPGHPDQPNTCAAGHARAGQGCTTDAQCPGGTANDCTGPRLDNYYGGTLVLDLPAGAKGKYTVNLNTEESFAAEPGAPPIVMTSAEENGFVVNFVTGSCCHRLGTPQASCVDTCINRSDCVALGAPFVFTPGGSCQADGTPAGCAECVNPGDDPLCDDNDECTTETCVLLGTPPLGVCQRGYIAGFNPEKGDPLTDTGNCCDPATGNLTDKDDDDACTADSCSAADNRGQAVHDPAGASGVPCNDGNSCSFGDRCNGVASEANGGCQGTGVVGQSCLTNADCQHGGETPTAVCTGGVCDCSVTPKLTYLLNEHAPGKLCIGGDNAGQPCAKPEDCPRGVCDIFPANCFDEGEKISALVHIGSAAEPINGGQFLIEYDPSCVTLNSAACLPPYSTTVYGPIYGSDSVFIACGVDPFAGVDGPLGNVNIVALNFTMIGQCNNCSLCFGGDGQPGGPPGPNNPQNTYLVDGEGYKVPVEPQCKEIAENGDLVLTVPDNITVNSDCDIPAANVTWDSPSASFSCGDVNLTCRGAHESGLVIAPAVVMNGGLLPQGANSFCCFASAKDKCEQTAGCAGDTNNCPGEPKPDGCWTVDVTDQTSLDIHIQLEPPLLDDEIERCIEFCLYGNCLEAPYCFEENVLFGGLYDFVGKASGDIKVPKGKWGCMTAQDQLHSLRSCDIPDCIDGQLVARFKGDPTYGGNWLIMGNIDAYKKSLPGEDPSLDVIDILDFGKFIAAFGTCYEDRKYGCHEGTHADIDGDGCVTAADYQFIVRNFLVSAKDCCCGPSAADLPPALTEVTIEELRQMGEDDMIVADLNGDGVLNADDMEAFTQGVRPAKSNDRKGGKGLRSGR